MIDISLDWMITKPIYLSFLLPQSYSQLLLNRFNNLLLDFCPYSISREHPGLGLGFTSSNVYLQLLLGLIIPIRCHIWIREAVLQNCFYLFDFLPPAGGRVLQEEMMRVIGYYFGLGAAHVIQKEIKIEINIVNTTIAFTSRGARATIRRSCRARGCRPNIF